MANDQNDELAGIISEPGRGAPEIKPARSLWPRPHEDVKIEPVLDEPSRVEPLVPRIQRDGDFETVPSEGYQAVTPPRAEEHIAAPEPVAERIVETPAEIVSSNADELLAEIARRLEPSFEKKEPVAETAPEVEAPRAEEPVVEAASKPVVAIEPEPVHGESEDAPVIEPRIEELAAEPPVNEEPTVEDLIERSEEDREREPTIEALAAASEPRMPNRISVLDADRSSESVDLDDTGGRSGRFLAMAAGIIVALALGALGFIYLAPAFGIGGTQTASNQAEEVAEAAAVPVAAASASPASVPTPVANANQSANISSDDLKAIRDHLDQLEQRFAKIESELASSNRTAVEASEKQIKELSARIERVEKRAPQSAGTAPTPTPTPVAATAPREPAAAPQTTASAPRDITAPSSTSNSQGTPAEPRASGSIANEAPASETPPAVPTPRPTATARAESAAPPTPRLGASPDSPVVNGWVVRDIYNGMAVLQGRRGMVEVEPGDELPDGNKVLAIRRLGGDWVVVTEQGIIASRQ
ncbi:hypothetical protein [Flaviflagellibacter deserti]|uniref:Uncharacterized protein n=1 Tax=Flaviflagellibacter deserti TaxID=2267266 RepID=A0ABV9Z5Z0_9HYPH